jgi:hypothetical protein
VFAVLVQCNATADRSVARCSAALQGGIAISGTKPAGLKPGAAQEKPQVSAEYRADDLSYSRCFKA